MSAIPFEEIRERVTTADVCRMYGIQIDRDGKALCPFHHDNKTPSLKIYPGDKGFYCFGCHVHGDVITFVALLHGLSTSDAAKEIDKDFSLGLVGNLTKQDYFAMAKRKAQRKAREQEFHQQREQLRHQWDESFDDEHWWFILWDALRKSPVSEARELVWLRWQCAKENTEYIEYQLDKLEKEYYEEKAERERGHSADTGHNGADAGNS